MTTRLIEDCFDVEDAEEIFRQTWFLWFDPGLISEETIEELCNPKPGKIIRMKNKGWGRGIIRCL